MGGADDFGDQHPDDLGGSRDYCSLPRVGHWRDAVAPKYFPHCQHGARRDGRIGKLRLRERCSGANRLAPELAFRRENGVAPHKRGVALVEGVHWGLHLRLGVGLLVRRPRRVAISRHRQTHDRRALADGRLGLAPKELVRLFLALEEGDALSDFFWHGGKMIAFYLNGLHI